jgi:hypothetical protein
MQHHTTVVGPFLKETQTVEDIALATVQGFEAIEDNGRWR